MTRDDMWSLARDRTHLERSEVSEEAGFLERTISEF
jgi:hypothetical protein